MATYYPYPPSTQFDRDHYTPHRSQQQQWHNSFQTNFHYDYNDHSSWSSGSAIPTSRNNGQSQPGSSSGSGSYPVASGVLSTPRSMYPVEAMYDELDFCRSPSNSSGSSAPTLQEDQFAVGDERRPSSTRPTSAASHEDGRKVEEKPVVVKQEDDASCFIMELSAPQVQSTLVSQSLAPPIEVPLRATHASRKMRGMMSSFRCNPFAVHAGGESAMAPDREEARPHEEEPLVFEFQVEHYIHDCPYDCESDLLTLSMDCGTDEKRRPALPKESLRAFSPSFELHSDSASVFGIPSEHDFDPATSASSASVSDHVGSEWGDYDLEGPGSASSYALSEEASSLSHRSAHDLGHARGRGLSQARVIKHSPTRAQSWDYHHTSISRTLTSSQEHTARYQDYQSDDNANVPHPNIPTASGSGLQLHHTPTSPTTRPNSTSTNGNATHGRKRSREGITQTQVYLTTGNSRGLTGPGRIATGKSHSRSSVRSSQSNGTTGGFGAGESFYSEAGSLKSSPSPSTASPTAELSQSLSIHRSSHPSGSSQFGSRALSSPYGVPAAGDSPSAALGSTSQWPPQSRTTASGGFNYSASGVPNVAIPMSLTSRDCATVFNTPNAGPGLTGSNISTLPPLTSAHRRWSLPDNVSTSHPQSYQAQFLV